MRDEAPAGAIRTTGRGVSGPAVRVLIPSGREGGPTASATRSNNVRIPDAVSYAASSKLVSR